jgi:hypothetical protein
MIRPLVHALALLCLGAATAAAQSPTGHVSVFFDYLPNRSEAIELRSRLFLEERIEPADGVRLILSGFAEGLLARRFVLNEADPASSGRERVTAGILRVQEANVNWTRGRLDVTAGFARVVWGKLDELQPTDVINPLDVSRFFFEGRNEARLPVALARGRLFVGGDTTIEGVYVPAFRRGRFDQLAEDSSPFNIAIGAAAGIGQPPAISDRAPAFAAENAQGGVRVSTTTGRVDWSVSGYRGFQPFAAYERSTGGPPPPALAVDAIHPRFTMFGADFAAVRGEWGMRGEVAAFVADTFQSADLSVVAGQSFDAGVGVDRRAGSYTVSGTVLVQAEHYDAPLVSAIDGATLRRHRTVSLIASADRTFARERFRLRTFGVYNATESSAFLRGIWMASLRDNVSLEASIGWFVGSGRDLIGRFSENDFAYTRLRYDF